MEIVVQRVEPTDAGAILGQMDLDGVFECYTLERWAVKVPAGRYRVVLYNSPEHKCVVPLLEGVAERTSIEIHIGNYPKDTKGCILVGESAGEDYLNHSAVAFEHLMEKLSNNSDNLWITIKDAA